MVLCICERQHQRADDQTLRQLLQAKKSGMCGMVSSTVASRGRSRGGKSRGKGRTSEVNIEEIAHRYQFSFVQVGGGRGAFHVHPGQIIKDRHLHIKNKSVCPE